ncbi:TPA: hypothetical protein NIA45_004648 [Pseudomonas aeruginosa]|nr:hypothetical protein [Pseudomonas aeruginosa]
MISSLTQLSFDQSTQAQHLVPGHLWLDAVVAVDEPSLAVSPSGVRQYLRDRMSPEAIEAEIDAISEVARLREEFGDFGMLGLKPMQQCYACVDSGTSLLTWMHEHERERLNQLKIALPTSAEQALAARARIQQRIALRKHGTPTQG